MSCVFAIRDRSRGLSDRAGLARSGRASATEAGPTDRAVPSLASLGPCRKWARGMDWEEGCRLLFAMAIEQAQPPQNRRAGLIQPSIELRAGSPAVTG